MRTFSGQSIPNIIPAGGDYPYGRSKDATTPTSLDGTPAQENSAHGMGDIYQAMIQLILAAGDAPDENPENGSNSQILNALNTLYANNAQPIAILSCDYEGGGTDNIVTTLVLGNGLAHTWTKNTFQGAGYNIANFKLNITDSGNYVVKISSASNIPYITTTIGNHLLIGYSAVHNSATGYFSNNTDSNIQIVAGDPGAEIALSESSFLASIRFILEIFRV